MSFNVTVYPLGAVGLLISVVKLYVPITVWFAVLPFHFPPFGSTVNVYCISFHCANRVVVDVGVYGSSAPPTLSPPVISVYQPFKVAPVFVGVGNVIASPTYCAVNVPAVSPNVYVVPFNCPPPVRFQLEKLWVCVIWFIVFPPLD